MGVCARNRASSLEVPLSVGAERKLADLQMLQLSFARKFCLSLQIVVGTLLNITLVGLFL